jgi:putative redox protein
MVQIDVQYTPGLRCQARHAPSGSTLHTDAPVDNHGRGESFSPTDLVATALGSCMLTVMGITAERHGWDLAGSRARVIKEMVQSPVRRIGRLRVRLELPSLEERARTTLERAAHTCPVHQSLHPDVAIDLEFAWGSA